MLTRLWDDRSVRAYWKNKVRQENFSWRRKELLSLLDMDETSWKCHSDGAYSENYEVERGKPHEWETQIMVGALSWRNWTDGGTVSLAVDRWLLPSRTRRKLFEYLGTKHGLLIIDAFLNI